MVFKPLRTQTGKPRQRPLEVARPACGSAQPQPAALGGTGVEAPGRAAMAREKQSDSFSAFVLCLLPQGPGKLLEKIGSLPAPAPALCPSWCMGVPLLSPGFLALLHALASLEPTKILSLAL